MPTCEPVQCDQEETTGELRSVISYGKRRRRRRAVNEVQDDLLLVQSIQITDKFGFNRDSNKTETTEAVFITNENGLCFNTAGLILAAIVFLSTQLAVIAAWTFIWQRKRFSSKLGDDSLSVTLSVPSGLSSNRTESRCQLYDAGYSHSRRF